MITGSETISIATVLQQMQATVSQAAGEAKALPADVGGFAGELRASLDKISQQQHAARKQAENFELGVPGVSLNDTMIDLRKASVALQLGIQVRNRLISAYQEVMNMHV